MKQEQPERVGGKPMGIRIHPPQACAAPGFVSKATPSPPTEGPGGYGGVINAVMRDDLEGGCWTRQSSCRAGGRRRSI